MILTSPRWATPTRDFERGCSGPGPSARTDSESNFETQSPARRTSEPYESRLLAARLRLPVDRVTSAIATSRPGVFEYQLK